MQVADIAVDSGLWPLLSSAGGADAGTALLPIALVLACAAIAGRLATRVGQPSVVGELVVGLVGALFITSVPESWLSRLMAAARLPGSHLDWLGQLGVLLLLFEAGLESGLVRLFRVGGAAVAVAVIGIVVPFGLGYGVCWAFPHAYPEGIDPLHVHLFVGAALTATSIGVTARVFRELHCSSGREAGIVLGAAVLDDVLALALLAILAGVLGGGVGRSAASGAESTPWGIAGAALAYLALTLTVGRWVFRGALAHAQRQGGRSMQLAFAVAGCLLFASAASALALAAIVGAFVAGAVALSETESSSATALREDVSRLTQLLSPVFFVVVGLRVQVEVLADWRSVLFGVALSVAAIAGKLACGLAVRGEWRSRLIVGLAMCPRGEVLLVFAALGQSLGLVNEPVYAALVMCVLLPNLVAPPLLARLLRAPTPTAPVAE